MATDYNTLSLHITHADNGAITTTATDSHGNTLATATAPLRTDPLILSRLDDPAARNLNETAALIQSVGSELYHALFCGEILGHFNALRRDPRDLRLRLVFKHDEPDLLRLPWEFLYDGSTYLAADPRLALARTLEGAPVRDRTPIKGKIRILVIISSPLDLPEPNRLRFEDEQLMIYQAIDRLDAENKVEPVFLDEASLKNIQDTLDEDEFHIIHYSGHGAYSQKDDTGYLILEDDAGKKTRKVDNKAFTDLLAAYPSIRLVMLSGCQTATTSGRRALRDLATPLILSGIPAVIAMQYPVTDSSAMTLAAKFYRELGDGAPIDIALARARRQLLLEEGHGRIEFATPVLFAGDPDRIAVTAAPTPESATGLKVTLKTNVVMPLQKLGRQFVGRQPHLRRIKEDFLSRGVRCVILHGIGGIGKTVTATQTAERLGRHFHGIFAFDCRKGLTIEEVIIQLNDFFKSRLGINQYDQVATAQIPVQQKVELLAQVLSQVRMLLIFDNFETLLSKEADHREIADPALAENLGLLIKQSEGGTRFIITSRYTFNVAGDAQTKDRLGNLIDSINLGEMSRTEALMVMNRFPEIAGADYLRKRQVFATIGGHPYTLNIFARHAAATSVEQVLSDLSGVQREMVEFTLIDKSYQRLSDRARTILDGAAVFKKAIRLSGLQWMVKTDADSTPDITAELEELIHWGMIIKLDQHDETFYQIHTLVRDFVHSETPEDTWRQRLVNGGEYYEDLVRNTTHDVFDWLDARELYFDAGEYNRAGEIVQNVMEVLHRWGLIVLVRELNEETIRTASGEVLAAAYHHLGMIHQGQGNYDQATEKYTESLKIFKQLGNKGGIASSLGQLGTIYDLQSDYQQAIEKFTECLDIFEQLGDNRGIATTLHQLGNVRLLQGDYDQAIAKYTDSLEIEKQLDNEGGIAISLHQLGMIHQVQGDYDQAIAKYTESFKIKEQLGDKSGMAITLHQLGRIHEKKDEHKDALSKYLIAASILEQLRSPNLRTAVNSIARLKSKLGETRFNELYNEIMSEQEGKT